MATATAPAAVGSASPTPEGPSTPARRGVPRWGWVLLVLAAWVVASRVWQDQGNLFLPGQGTTGVQEWFTRLKADLIAGRDTNPVMQVTGVVSDAFNAAVGWLQGLVSVPDFPRPVPQIGWLGVVAIGGWLALAAAGWRYAIGTMAALASVGLLGYWSDGMDTLVITFFSVAICLVIGLPIAVLMGTRRRVDAVVTPVLDVLQTFPSFVYLAPAALFFGIGSALAVAVTVLYALPPVIRVAAHGIREVSPVVLEATASLGQSRWQQLRKVQLPMARRTIIVGINLTTMAALAMSVIAGFVDGPGVGGPVKRALEAGSLQVGVGFTGGLVIVIIAIMLDRVTTAAGERAELVARGGGGSPRNRRILLGATGVAAIVAVVLSRRDFALAEFPETSVGPRVADAAQSASEWVTGNLGGLTTGISQGVTTYLLNPLQDVLAGSPWLVSGGALLVLSLVLGGWRAGVITLGCLAGIRAVGLWYDTMVTLNQVIVATLFVGVIALVVGVAMGRSRRLDRAVRPVLDAAQVMPAFVYLIPALLLFGPARFTAIVAAVIYAAPVGIKLVADGIRQVAPATVEAATAAGSTPWQLVTKVQLPMARSHLVLAANQSLLYVLSVVVIGGLVSGGALGYDVLQGFSRGEFFGKGLCAGLAIVLIGVMLDRTARLAAARVDDRATAAH